MDIYTTEQEQIEKIKAFVKDYGLTIVISIVFVLLASFTWRWWSEHQNTLSTRASVAYEQMFASLMSNDKEKAKIHADNLIKNYSKTPYAQFASLILAQWSVYNNDLSQALTHLNWVMTNAKDSSLRQVARNRAARVLLQKNDPKASLAMLNTVDDKTYVPIISVIKGDAYLAEGNKTEAINAYQQAILNLPKGDPNHYLVQMKLADIASLRGQMTDQEIQKIVLTGF